MIDYSKKYRLIYQNGTNKEIDKLIKAGTRRNFEVNGKVLNFKIDSILILKIDTTKVNIKIEENKLIITSDSGRVYHFEQVLPKKKEK